MTSPACVSLSRSPVPVGGSRSYVWGVNPGLSQAAARVPSAEGTCPPVSFVFSLIVKVVGGQRGGLASFLLHLEINYVFGAR